MWLLLPWKWNLVVRVDEIGSIYLNLDKENRYHRSGDPCWPFDTVLTRQAHLTSLRQSDRIITVSSLTLSDDLRLFLSSRLFNHAVSPWGELSEWWGEEMQWLNIDGEKLFYSRGVCGWVGWGCHQKRICFFFRRLRAAAEEWMSRLLNAWLAEPFVWKCQGTSGDNCPDQAVLLRWGAR